MILFCYIQIYFIDFLLGEKGVSLQEKPENQKLFESFLKSLNNEIKTFKIENPVGFKIKRIRELIGLSQKELANRIGKSRSLIEKYENDTPPKKGINLIILRKILAVLNDLSSSLFSVTDTDLTEHNLFI